MSGTRSFNFGYDSAGRPNTIKYPSRSDGSREMINYNYDAGWRPTELCTDLNTPGVIGGSGCYIDRASYNALSQPLSLSMGDEVWQNYSYDNQLSRLTRLQVSPASSPGGLPSATTHYFDRSYTYDPVGNVSGITNNVNGQVQTFGYDDRDRLTSASAGAVTGDGGYNENYTYDTIGNITNKAGVGYTYPAGGSAHPHAPNSVGGSAYSYDNNGNLTSGSNRSYSWNVENKPTSITGADGIVETYGYDAEGARVTRTRNGITTVYIQGGSWEEDSGSGAIRQIYTFGGKVVAQRDFSTGQVSQATYLSGDHLGSASVATNSAGQVVSQQEFDPWGKVRLGGISQTSINYTGQRLDGKYVNGQLTEGTGLIYLHARYYDPDLGKFISPDPIVPGMASAKGGAAAGTIGQDDKMELRGLTVDFHEPGFVKGLQEENSFTMEKGFLFQLGEKDRKDAKNPMGPANPQALNRYSHVLNNPIRYVDPTGHYYEEILWWRLFNHRIYPYGYRLHFENKDVTKVAYVLSLGSGAMQDYVLEFLNNYAVQFAIPHAAILAIAANIAQYFVKLGENFFRNLVDQKREITISFYFWTLYSPRIAFPVDPNAP